VTRSTLRVLGLWAAVGLALVAQPLRAEVTVSVGDEPPEGYAEQAAKPAERPPVIGGRSFPTLQGMSDVEMDAEVEALTAERDARIKSAREWQQELESVDAQLSKAKSERDKKNLMYERARTNYLLAVQRQQIQVISDRLDEIAKERVRRTGQTVPAPEDPNAAPNINQMLVAVQLMGQYDEQIREILSRDPVTELDLIEALTVLKRRELLTDAFHDYFKAIAVREGVIQPSESAEKAAE